MSSCPSSVTRVLENAADAAVVACAAYLNEKQDKPWEELSLKLWNQAARRYATDGAGNALKRRCESGTAKLPHVVSGDFDSILPEVKRFFETRTALVHTPDQDETDATKAIKLVHSEAEEHKISRILVLANLGGRFDHVLGLLSTLLVSLRLRPDLPISLLHRNNLVHPLIEGSHRLSLRRDQLTGVCGLTPISQRVTTIRTAGFKWNLDDEPLEYGVRLSTSNELKDDQLEVRCSAPVLLTFELKDKGFC